jgi:hypothetical protein
MGRILIQKLIVSKATSWISRPIATNFYFLLYNSQPIGLSWAWRTHSLTSYPVSLRSLQTLSSHLFVRLQGSLLPSNFPTKSQHSFFFSYNIFKINRPPHNLWRMQARSSSLYSFLQLLLTSSFWGSNVLFSTLILRSSTSMGAKLQKFLLLSKSVGTNKFQSNTLNKQILYKWELYIIVYSSKNKYTCVKMRPAWDGKTCSTTQFTLSSTRHLTVMRVHMFFKCVQLY